MDGNRILFSRRSRVFQHRTVFSDKLVILCIVSRQNCLDTVRLARFQLCAVFKLIAVAVIIDISYYVLVFLFVGYFRYSALTAPRRRRRVGRDSREDERDAAVANYIGSDKQLQSIDFLRLRYSYNKPSKYFRL